MARKTNHLTELKIQALALHRETGLPWIIFQECQHQWPLTLEIGAAEANSILAHFEEIHPKRPLTHDLLAHVFRLGKMQGLHLLFYSIDAESRLLCRIHYKKGWSEGVLEVRPSDGIALAVRLPIPIFADLKILPDWAEKPESQSQLQKLDKNLLIWKTHEPKFTVPRTR